MFNSGRKPHTIKKDLKTETVENFKQFGDLPAGVFAALKEVHKCIIVGDFRDNIKGRLYS